MQYFFYAKITGVDKTFFKKSFTILHIKMIKKYGDILRPYFSQPRDPHSE